MKPIKITALQQSKLKIILITMSFSWFTSFSQESWEWGNKHTMVVDHASAPLQVKMSGTASLSSFRFVSHVGGVAFNSIAKPDSAIAKSSISILYHNQNEDGQRLLVLIDKDTLLPKIYDWQLIPIAKYSNSEYHACVSLFGEKTDEYKYDIIYHPAFQNTLLGIRLLNADILLMDLEEFSQIPHADGNAILGDGEEIGNREIPYESTEKINSAFKNEIFKSWVLTDNKVKVVFKKENNLLTMSGFPFYHFWTFDESSYIKERDSLIKKAKYAEMLNDIITYNKIAEKIDTLQPKIIYKKRLTEKIKLLRNELEEVNPLVYNSALNTMRYSAFFRYVKKKNPASWTHFIAKIKIATITPKIKTPTIWNK
jgi:hypothetical protein